MVKVHAAMRPSVFGPFVLAVLLALLMAVSAAARPGKPQVVEPAICLKNWATLADAARSACVCSMVTGHCPCELAARHFTILFVLCGVV